MKWPQHRVCGEYISNEILPFLKSLGFDPFEYGAVPIRRLRITTPSGKSIYPPLGLGGFGLSRYTFDHKLFELAQKSGTSTLTNTKVSDIVFADNIFTVKTNTGETFSAKIVIGSYGKRDTLDKQLNRPFMQTHTGYMGVKYHIKTEYPDNEIGLHNFERGYCGISRIENGKYNLCYLFHRKNMAKYNTIADIESAILFKNPVLKNIFSNSEFLFAKPVVINDFTFAPKSLVENHILMCGDSAGLITPLCGNGMAMAIHAAKILSGLIIQSRVLDNNLINTQQRAQLEKIYVEEWCRNFSRRLFWGRTIQKLFGNRTLTGLAIHTIHIFPPVEKWLIGKTHGREIAI